MIQPTVASAGFRVAFGFFLMQLLLQLAVLMLLFRLLCLGSNSNG